ncbi:MAG: ABC transporter ATP-binding protein [Candidatus Zixiibacteriota bacterium]
MELFGNEAVIQVDDVVKEFTQIDGNIVTAVDHASFSVKSGEIFGILGPNGAGKTTTLRMISTVMNPTSGKVKVAGLDTSKKPREIRNQIGFLSGSTGLYKRLKAYEMVEYFGNLYNMPQEKLKERTDKLFEILKLEEFRDVLCEKLSSGNKQKVSIARTVIHDPPILVFDEPTTGLDVIIAENLLDFIEGLKREKKTIIFSTHIMEEAERLCDRIALISNGKILFTGTLKEILTRATEIAGSEIKTLKQAFFSFVQYKQVGSVLPEKEMF